MSDDQQTLGATRAQDTDDGGWMALPDVEAVVGHATPFPDFDTAGKWRVREAVHDANLAQLRRLTEREVTDA